MEAQQFHRFLTILACSFLILKSSSATTVLMMDEEDRILRSERICSGHVDSIKGVVTPTGVMSLADFKIQSCDKPENWSAPQGGERIWVAFPGGTALGKNKNGKMRTTMIPGAPRLEAGLDYVLYLSSDAELSQKFSEETENSQVFLIDWLNDGAIPLRRASKLDSKSQVLERGRTLTSVGQPTNTSNTQSKFLTHRNASGKSESLDEFKARVKKTLRSH